MKLKIVVLGSTGKTGQPIVEELLHAGHQVRAVIRREDERSARLRSAGAETVLGDVHDIASVRELVKEMDRIYFAYPPYGDRLVEATANLAIAAKEEGISGVVNMSQISVRENPRSALTRHHWLSEHIFDMAPIGAIHIRPNYFMENLFMFCAQTIASEGKIYLPYGTQKHAPIAARDIARAAVSLLLNPAPHAGERVLLTGPENLSIAEMAVIIGNEIGRPVEYVDLPAEQWRDILIGQTGLPEFLAEHLYQVAIDHQDGIFNRQTDAVETLTGVAPQRLEEFVREHLALFKGQEAVFLGV